MKKIILLIEKCKIPFRLFIFFSLAYGSCDKKNTDPGTGNNTTNNVDYGGSFMKADPNDSTDAYGTITATFNMISHLIDYKISWHLLSSLPNGMHFHDAGPIIAKINNFPVGISETTSGSATFTSAQADDLSNGLIYVMIHTRKYPNGEIMAYLTKQ